MGSMSAQDRSDFFRQRLLALHDLGIGADAVLAIATRYGQGLQLTVDGLRKFMRNETKHLSEPNARKLWYLLVATDFGRCCSLPQKEWEEPRPIDAFRQLNQAIGQSIVTAAPKEVAGCYFGYHRSFRTKGAYSARAIEVRRGEDGLLTYEDYLEDKTRGEVFHNIGVVVFISDKPQFLGVDVAEGKNIRLFIPESMESPLGLIRSMEGPMTNWTRDDIPKNRKQRLIRVEESFDELKKRSCVEPYGALPLEHRRHCKELKS